MPLKLHRGYLVAAIVAGLSLLVAVCYWQFLTGRPSARARVKRPELTDEEKLPFEVGRPSFVSSKTCLKCHAEQHRSWHDSYHRTMTQVANPKTVVAPFDEVKLESRGRTYHLQRFDDEFWVTMADPQKEARLQTRGVNLETLRNVPLLPQKVVLTTGSLVAQTYWVSSADGLWQMPWVYHIPERTWIPNDDSFLLPPDFGRLFNRWNSNCIKCHTS